MKKTSILISLLLLVGIKSFGALRTITDTPLYKNKKATVNARVEDLLQRMTLKEKIQQLQNRARAGPMKLKVFLKAKVTAARMK